MEGVAPLKKRLMKQHWSHTALLSALLLAMCVVCTACADSQDDGMLELSSSHTVKTRTLRVLSIGNSFSLDALAYVPHLMAELAPDVDLTLSIAVEPSCSLQKHMQNLADGTTYTIHRNQNSEAWTQTDGITLARALDAAQWDIIILQQVSWDSYNYDTYQPHLDNLIATAQHHLAIGGTLAWLITPAYAQGSNRLGTIKLSSDEMARLIGQCAQRVTHDTSVDMILPCGTALQLARHTAIDKYGAAGHLTVDGSHLQTGIACLTEAYAATEALLRWMRYPKSISTSVLVPNEQMLTRYRVPSQALPAMGLNAGNIPVAKQCALQAIDSPFFNP